MPLRKRPDAARVIFTGTADWWNLVCGIETGEAWEGDWEAAAYVAELDLDDEECWVCRIEAVDAEHTALSVGDYVCCQGVGSDVTIVRLQ